MSSLSVAAQIALVLLGALAVVGVVAILVLLVQLRRLGNELRNRAAPLLDRSSVVASNLEYITAQVRTDVERLNDSVEGLTRRLNQASDHMEDRIEEFNALMEVVQGEAEGVFLETAATVRGIRAGARELAGGGDRPVGGGRGVEGDDARASLPPETAEARPEGVDRRGPDGARERSA